MIPAVLLVGLPRLLLQTGRYFDLGMLSRAIPELVVLLGICAALSLLNSVLRLVMLARPLASRRSTS